jgi:hypothetical protein
VLREIGTAKSLPALKVARARAKAVTVGYDTARAAQEAIDAIEGRK